MWLASVDSICGISGSTFAALYSLMYCLMLPLLSSSNLCTQPLPFAASFNSCHHVFNMVSLCVSMTLCIVSVVIYMRSSQSREQEGETHACVHLRDITEICVFNESLAALHTAIKHDLH